jgi:hypothetical protein
MNKFFLSLLLITAYTARGQNKLTINEEGQALKSFYLGLQVEQLWQSGQHVNWETGEPDQADAASDIHTHCSAFVAAACKRLNIYLLRPPEHKTQLLANAQYDWLKTTEGVNAGWLPISTGNIYEEAQKMANKGYVVIATFKNTDPKVPGHIALVTPAGISPERISDSGPMLIMASTHNYNYISLKAGFRSHITQWPESQILFYYNTAATPTKLQARH